MGERRMKPVRAPRRQPGSRVHSELAAGIGRRILDGSYPPGSLLPNEAEWGQMFGASRTAVREAIRTLNGKGLLVSRPKIGSRVEPRERWNLLDRDVMAWHRAALDERTFLLSLQEIRRIWVVDKHEMEDVLPRIYREETGEPYPGKPLDDNLVLGAEQMNTLGELCGEDRLHYELTRELLSVTNQQRSSGRRSGLFDQLEKTFGKHFYDDKADALDRAKRLLADRTRAKDRSGPVAEDGGGVASLAKEVTA